MKKVDVAIIGTGPGGGMAACCLAKTGLKVLVLEKSKLPRSKACGGALSPGVKKLIDWDFSSLVEVKVVAGKYFYNYNLPKEILSENSKNSQNKVCPALMVNRSRFDYHFIERAVSLGKGNVTLWDGFRVVQVKENDNSVVIQGSNQEMIEADFLIAADGATSITAKCLGLNQKAGLGLAIDAEIEVKPTVYEAENKTATFNIHFPSNGYSWIFPKAGYLSCGVMSWTGQQGLSKAMNEFLEKSFSRESMKSVKTLSHPIPLYNSHRQIATRRVCLVGDAANLVDPFLGEGIKYALMSGTLAANIISSLMKNGLYADMIKEIESNPQDCRIYQKLIHQGIGKHLNSIKSSTLEPLLYAPELAYRSFILGENSDELYRQLPFLKAFDIAILNEL